MTLYTKSIQKRMTKNDGIIICIMRRPGNWASFDLWFPILAPSDDLLTKYHQKKYDWNNFKKHFKREVIFKQQRFIKLLVEIAKKRKVTICCWEKTPEKCHRRLIAEECRRLDRSLKIILK